MSIVKITEENEKILVRSTYHPDLPQKAKNLGGKWNGKEWVFDSRDVIRVKELYKSIYGSDGSNGSETEVTVEITVKKKYSVGRGGIFLFGRCIATAFGRDSGAKLGNGIIVKSGEGFDSGGSIKNWFTRVYEDTIFEIRDVPRNIINDENAEGWFSYKIVNEIEINRENLLKEKESLLKRIAEIDSLLEN